jgi:hypothetical protein
VLEQVLEQVRAQELPALAQLQERAQELPVRVPRLQ